MLSDTELEMHVRTGAGDHCGIGDPVEVHCPDWCSGYHPPHLYPNCPCNYGPSNDPNARTVVHRGQIASADRMTVAREMIEEVGYADHPTPDQLLPINKTDTLYVVEYELPQTGESYTPAQLRELSRTLETWAAMLYRTADQIEMGG